MKTLKISFAIIALVVVWYFSLLLDGWQLAWSFILVAIGYLLCVMRNLNTK